LRYDTQKRFTEYVNSRESGRTSPVQSEGKVWPWEIRKDCLEVGTGQKHILWSGKKQRILANYLSTCAISCLEYLTCTPVICNMDLHVALTP